MRRTPLPALAALCFVAASLRLPLATARADADPDPQLRGTVSAEPDKPEPGTTSPGTANPGTPNPGSGKPAPRATPDPAKPKTTPAPSAAPRPSRDPAGPPTLSAEQQRQLTDIKTRLETAWKDTDQQAIYDAIFAAWEIDPIWARASAYELITHQRDSVRPVGVALMREKATPADLAAAARALNQREHADERRLLVRALGSRRGENVYDLAASFLSDRDLMVRAAALAVLADVGRPEAVGLFMHDLRDVPAVREKYDDDEQGILNATMYGVVAALTDLRPQRPADVQRWWEAARGAPARKLGWPERDPRSPLEGRRSGRRFYLTPQFDVFFRLGSEDTIPTRGDLSWEKLADMIEDAAGAARASAEPVFGRVHVPPVRFYLADDRQFPALAGNTFFGGVSTGNEVVLRLARPDVMAAVMTHEYVHVIHQFQFRDQPRWMVEGLAESLTLSPERSIWSMARVQRLGIERDVERGAFGQITQWSDSGSSDSREPKRYALSHLAIDYLRFAGFVAPDERLFMLMGRLARRQSDARALEDLYGIPVRELDRRVRDWVQAR